MTEPAYTYIECDYCKIGGYDLCPRCFGGGGYSVENSKIPDKAIKVKNQRYKIAERLNKIETSNVQYNQQLNEFLNQTLTELSLEPPSDEIETLKNQIVRIKATKETGFWIKHFKEKINHLALDIYKFAIRENDLTIHRIKPRELAPENRIILFAAQKEIFSTSSEHILFRQGNVSEKLVGSDIFRFLQVLIENSIFCIRYGQNDMEQKSAKDFIQNLKVNEVLGFEVHTSEGKAFFINELKTLGENWLRSKKNN